MRLACSVVLSFCAAVVAAQEPFAATDSLGPYGRVTQSWVALRVSPGREASAMDHIRDKYGEKSVSIATGLRGRVRERVHENPAGLPGKGPLK